jgi:predicted ester cyclase
MTSGFVHSLTALSFLTLVACEAPQPPAPSDQTEANKAVVMRATELINGRDYETLKEVIAEDYLRHSQATPGLEVTNIDQFVAFLKQGAVSFPDDKAIFKVLVAEGDLVAFWGNYEGTNTGPGPFPPTGQFASVEMAGIHRIEDGKIAETWVIWDNMAMFAQLGIQMAPMAPPADQSDVGKAATEETPEETAETP